MSEYLYIIYSCYKNIKKANLLYNLLNGKVANGKVYILFGNPTLQTNYTITDDKYLIIKCGDYYENLCQKTIILMKTVSIAFPDIKGLFKIDDDILPNMIYMNKFLEQIQNIDYAGRTLTIINTIMSRTHYNKCSINIKYNIPKTVHSGSYAAGPLYYLSKKSIDILSNTLNIKEYFYEDIMVGRLLNKNGIGLHNYFSYYDVILYEKVTIQNIYNLSFLFTRIHGGLGNQLFIVAAAYGIAKKYNMIPILLIDSANIKHKTSDNFATTIFKNFPSTSITSIDKPECVVYNEPRCFEYNPSIIKQKANYLLNGYFQNKRYIPDMGKLTELFQNDEICASLLLQYPILEQSYFIHIRRGDYLNKGMYHFDKDAYYQLAIERILEKDSDAHFFILSDDVSFVKKYELLDKINKTVIEEMNTLDTFYFMSMCKKGGICANSTFSGWASQLNMNKDKIIIVPRQWINIDYPYEIPFEYTLSLPRAETRSQAFTQPQAFTRYQAEMRYQAENQLPSNFLFKPRRI